MTVFLMSIVDLAVQAQDAAAQPGPLWILGQAGIIGAITVTFGMLHRSAVNAYKESAAKSDRIAELERKRADENQVQIMQLLAPIRKASDAL